MIGQTLGHYRIESKLGEGGMGVVYKAYDTHLDRPVAIKVLRPDAVVDPERRRRFVREAKSASALNHPNIITIYDIGTADETGFIAMEHVSGKTLDRWIAGKGLHPCEVLNYAVQIAGALARAHQAGIVHRDLKPSNIMVNEDGLVKILDFGLAKLTEPAESDPTAPTRTLGSQTEEGTIVGTAAYMSPEQAEGRKVDARSDIFSFGSVLYEMVTGRRAFGGTTNLAVLSAIAGQEPTPVSHVIKNTPAELERILAWCLRKDPARRYQNIADVKLALEQLKEDCESGRATAALPARWPLPAVARALGVAGAMLAACGALYLMLRDRSRPPPEAWVIRPLTSFAGAEWSPSWSPDGSFIAYSHGGTGNLDVWVVSPGGGDPLRRTQHPADDLTPRWSPDGRYLAFASDRGTGTNIYLVAPLKGAERKLVETNIPALERFADLLSALGAAPWSPDGRELLFSRLQPTGEIALWKVRLETGQETQVTKPPPGSDDLEASWSFDGERIAFTRRQGGRQSLAVMPAQRGEPRLLLRDEFNSFAPAWSAGNQRIVFVSNRAGPLNLWDVEVASGRLRQLTSGPGADWFPAVGRQGPVAYQVLSHQTDLYRLALHDGAEQRITSHTRDNFGPRYSPDGKKVVYYSNRGGNYEIWLLDAETHLERQLTNHPALDMAPDWSPDGRQIAFLSNREGVLQLWVMDAEGVAPRRMTDQALATPAQLDRGPGSLRLAPRWSPDGQAIGYFAGSEKGMALWVIDRDGKNARPRLFGAVHFDWYEDSRRVIYTRRQGGILELRAANLDTGEEATLQTGPHVELDASPDGQFVAYCDAASHFGMNVYVLPLAAPNRAGGLPRPAGAPRRLTLGKALWHAHGPSWAPDGKSLIYTRDTDAADIYTIENYR